MTEEDEINVELEPEAPEPPVVIEDEKPETPPVAEKHEIAPEEGIEELKTKLAAEKFRADHAEDQARKASQDAFAAKNEVQDSQLSVVTTAIGQIEQNLEVLESNLANFHAAQDFPAVAKAQREIARNEAQLLQLQQGKAQLESQPKQQYQPQFTDMAEAVASQLQASSPRSADWIRRHPEYARSDDGLAQVRGADALARKAGFVADTDAYFDKVEELLGIKPAEIPVNPVEPQRRAAPAAAPVSRGTNGDGSGPKTVRLSAEEREMADNMGISYQQWGKDKLALEAEGKIGRLN